MTSEELERAIEFLTNSQAKNRRDILSLNRAVNKLAERFSKGRELTGAGRQERLGTQASQQEVQKRMNAHRQEIREAISRLLISNEVTRDLAQEVERELAITTSQIVTALENKQG